MIFFLYFPYWLLEGAAYRACVGPCVGPCMSGFRHAQWRCDWRVEASNEHFLDSSLRRRQSSLRVMPLDLEPGIASSQYSGLKVVGFGAGPFTIKILPMHGMCRNLIQHLQHTILVFSFVGSWQLAGIGSVQNGPTRSCNYFPTTHTPFRELSMFETLYTPC